MTKSMSESNLTSYATLAADGGGRVYDEREESSLRGPFELDRHCIMESAAFRRLEGKTQVFAPSYHDHFRTRMTHTLEVAQIARTLACVLRVNEPLSEAIALAHDLGHPPFGHAGEAALDEAMSQCGGFNHNGHSLRVVEFLEHPFPAFRGLNLTAATREGLAAHATSYDDPMCVGAAGVGSVEAQVVSIADRIAFNTHDLEDAIGAEFVDGEALAGVVLWREACAAVDVSLKSEPLHAVRRLVLNKLLDTLLIDVVETSRPLLREGSVSTGVVAPSRPKVLMSQPVEGRLVELEEFLASRVYRHPSVAKLDAGGRERIAALFAFYRAGPDKMPLRFASRVDEQGVDRVICDYIAGMTDRFCTKECERIGRSS